MKHVYYDEQTYKSNVLNPILVHRQWTEHCSFEIAHWLNWSREYKNYYTIIMYYTIKSQLKLLSWYNIMYV